MKNKRMIFYIVVVLLVMLEVTSIFLMYKSSNNKEYKFQDVYLKDVINDEESFSLFVEQEDGTYGSVSSVPENTVFNTEKSYCKDMADNIVENVIEYDDTTDLMTVTSNKTVYCYMYFDIDPVYAIYSETDNSLRFYNNKDKVSVGDVYKDLVVTAKYYGFEEDKYINISEDTTVIIPNTPWYEYADVITTVVVEDEISPISTAVWFSNLEKVSKIDVTNINTSQVTDMAYMFYYSGYNVTNFEIIGLDNWNTSNVTNIAGIFYGTGYNSTIWSIGDLSNWDTSKVISMHGLFYNTAVMANSFNVGNIGNWDTSKVTTMSAMFANAGSNASSWNIGDLSKWDTSNVTNMYAMFYETAMNANTFNLGDLSSWDTSKVTNMHAMFARAGLNASYTLDLSGWQVPLVTDYTYFNYGVESKITPPIWVA